MNMTSEAFGKSNNFADILINLNSMSEGWFIGLFLIFVWLIIISIMKNQGSPFDISFVSGGFVIITFCALFFAMGVIDVTFLVLSIVITVAGVAYTFFR